MEVFITPPIPTRRGLVVTEPGTWVLVQIRTGPLAWEDLKEGKASDLGEFYFLAKAMTTYRVFTQGEELEVHSDHLQVFNSSFASPEMNRDLWQSRGTTYEKGVSDSAKASDDCAQVDNGKLVLSVMEGEREGTFLTGHVATGEIHQAARFAFTHGWACARVKVHPLQGAMSGFWLQGMNGYAVGAGECDVMEWGGRKNLTGKSGYVHNTIWYNDGTGGVIHAGPTDIDMAELNLDPVSHPVVFSVNWTADYYDFWVNTRRVARITDGLSSDPKFLVASILVRNWQLDDMIANLGKIATFKAEFDWIRVWK